MSDTAKQHGGKAPLTDEAREQLKRELKQQVSAFADELKKQLKAPEGEKQDLSEAMRKAEAEVEKKMQQQTARDTLDVATPQDAAKPAPEQVKDEQKKAAASALPKEELTRLTQDIIAALKTIYDPEIPVDIYELGLIYRIDISDDKVITIDMTLTAPGCPVAGDMPGWVEKAVKEVEGVKDVHVNLVFDPPWDMSRMSDEARLALNMW